jgi:hypothetical protein
LGLDQLIGGPAETGAFIPYVESDIKWSPTGGQFTTLPGNTLTSVNGMTDLAFTSSTSAGNGNTDYWHSTLSREVSSGLAQAALLDQSPYTGALNPGIATTFQFGAAVPLNATFFVFGRGNEWPTSAIATDVAGADLDLTVSIPSPGSTFALTVTGTPWARNPGANFGDNLAGWTLDLAEFTGTGNPADVGGLRLDRGDGNFDPTLVGYGVIPEPSSAALILVFGSLLLARFRRSSAAQQ